MKEKKAYKRIECCVSGRVQGVMFRDFSRRKARKLGILGTVQNTREGTVLVSAEGKEEKLKEFIAFLHRGSLPSRVDHVEVRWADAHGEFDNFRIVF